MLISVTGQSIRVPCGEMLVSNSVGIYRCNFTFSEDWDGWSKTAVFRSENGNPWEVPIIDGAALVPHEALESPGALTIGVYGTQGEKIKPVVWSENIIVRAGTPTGSPSSPPSPSVYSAILEALNDKVSKGQGIENAGKYLKVGVDGNVTLGNGGGGVGGAVDSVNGQTGEVVLTAEDVGALPDDTEIPNVPAWAMQPSKPTYNAQEVGALPVSTTIPSALSDLSSDAQHRTVTDAEKASWSGKQPAGDYATSASVTALQGQIDALVSKSDVVDVVGTYAELQAYDTSALLENDVVKVLNDSTHAGGRSYYRWTDGAWDDIGTESVGYTKSETDTLLNGKQNTISDLETIREGAAAGATALQSIPVAGASLGGVKNGGNVTINADGTMTAPSGTMPLDNPICQRVVAEDVETYTITSDDNGNQLDCKIIAVKIETPAYGESTSVDYTGMNIQINGIAVQKGYGTLRSVIAKNSSRAGYAIIIGCGVAAMFNWHSNNNFASDTLVTATSTNPSTVDVQKISSVRFWKVPEGVKAGTKIWIYKIL